MTPPLPPRHPQGRKRNATPHNAPELVRQALAVIDRTGATCAGIERRAGLADSTIANLRRQGALGAVALDQLLRACGYRLAIVPLDDS